MPSSTALALLLLRLAFGLVIAAHGAVKVAAWAGGSTELVAAAGGTGWAVAAIAGELLGGLGLAAGLLTRLAGAGVAAVMLGVVLKFHTGLFTALGTGKGVPLEYPLLVAVVGFAFLLGGAGPYSLDALWHGRGRQRRSLR